MKKLISLFAVVLAFAPLAAYGVSPSAIGDAACKAGGNDVIGCGSTPLLGQGSVFFKATNAVIYVVAAAAVFMIVLGGLRYVLSGGDSAGIRSAKDTIIYALVGLVIAVFAFSIVNFVIGRF